MAFGNWFARRGTMVSKLDEATFRGVIGCVSSSRDKEGKPLAMDSVAVSTREHSFQHAFRAGSAALDLRSVSKPVLCLGLGVALEEGLKIQGERIGIETAVWKFFEPHVRLRNSKNLKHLRELRLKHLLNSTLGTHDGIMFRKDIGDRDESTLLDYIFNCDFVHAPGKHFVYSNAGAFLVSVLLQLGTGVEAVEFIRRKIFNPLGIKNVSWRSFGAYTAGCTGLLLEQQEFHKLGRLLADDGKFAGKQVAPRRWVVEMKKSAVPTPSMYDEKRAFPKFAYGHFLWKTKTGHAYCDGTDGQYLIVLADNNTVITTLGHQPDMKPITECFRPLL